MKRKPCPFDVPHKQRPITTEIINEESQDIDLRNLGSQGGLVYKLTEPIKWYLAALLVYLAACIGAIAWSLKGRRRPLGDRF